MSGVVDDDPTPIESREQLLEFFRSGATPRQDRGVGTEHEKFVFWRRECGMVTHGGAEGIETIFERLEERYDWRPIYEGDLMIGMTRGDAAISLEPGGQFELSGGIKSTIHGTADELDCHLEELKDVAGENVKMVSWGINPFVAPEDVPMMPKQRYDIMRAYLPARGALAPWMMKTSTTIQANFDYTDEADATDLMRTALLISPIVSAIFANSPIRDGTDTGMQSYRGYIWTKTDPDRTGWPDFMYREDWGFGDYLDYILDIPMFFIQRNGRLIPKTGQTFRDYLDGGSGRYEPTMADFQLHLSTAFPEIRLKQYVEVRGADGGPYEQILGLPALWKGLLYDDSARRRARDLLDDMAPDEHRQLFYDVYADGFDAHGPDGTVGELADALIEISADGLRSLADEQGLEVDETGYLRPLRQIVTSRRTLADELRDMFIETGGDCERIVDEWAFF
jgi:glutamate--cysteine ligase